MKARAACLFLLAPLSAAATLLVSSPGAGASPSCDPSTADGYLDCMGGGIPWQSQDGSSSDTYGALGPQGFIAESRKMGVLSNKSDAMLLKIGQAICADIANGDSEESEKYALMRYGVPDAEAGAAVTLAQMYLC